MNKSELKNFIESKFEALMKNPHYAFTCQAKVYQNILKEVENLEPTSEEAWKKVGEFYGKNQYEAVSTFEAGIKASRVEYDATKTYRSSTKLFKVSERINSNHYKGYAGKEFDIETGEFDESLKFRVDSVFDWKAREATAEERRLFNFAEINYEQGKEVDALRETLMGKEGE